MQYFLCPNCKFKMAGKTRLCSTCGYQMPRNNSASGVTEVKETKKKASFMARFFGLGSDDQQSSEGGAEKPALG